MLNRSSLRVEKNLGIMIRGIIIDKRKTLFYLNFPLLKCGKYYLNSGIWSVLVFEIITWKSLFCSSVTDLTGED